MPKFPFTNYHELNLDWILKKVDALFDASEENARTIRTYDTRLTRAEQTATNAETAATAAQELADSAAENANSALSVAGTANTKADSALTAATTAAGAAAGAMTTAQEARQIAENAQSAAADAGALANDASNAAAAAQQTADTNAGNIADLQTAVEEISSKVPEIDNKADVIIANASGSFADGANDMPFRSLITNIDPVQAGSGDPSPTNVRPITGHTECSVVRTGKNIFNPSAIHENAYINTSGEITSNNSYSYSDKIKVLPNTIYSIQQNRVTNGTSVSIAYYNDDTFIIRDVVVASGTPQFVNASFTTPNNCNYIAVSFGKGATNIQLESGTMTAFETYTPTTLNISWQSAAGTVYGGTLDVISGLLTVDRTIITLLGSNAWSELNGYYRMVFALSNYSNIYTKLTSNMFLFSDTYSDTAAYVTAAGTIFAPKNITETYTLAEWKTFLNSNPLIVVYPITTPTTYQLTGQQINTLLGQNSIYSDVGSIADVQYPADTKLYIDGKIAELQALILEN